MLRHVARLIASLKTTPDRSALAEFAVAAALTAAVIGPLGFATGLLRYEPREAGAIAALALTAFFIPALGEEAMFRGLLVPSRSEQARPWAAIAASTGLFSAWHLVEILWLPKAAALFARPDFLLWTIWLGLVCAILRWRSGSLWPAVVLHWAAVVAWQGWLGGPGAAALR